MRTQVLMAAVGLALTGFGAGYSPDLIYYSKLDSAADITSPTVGPAGTVNGATFQEGKVGNALYVPDHSNVAQVPFANGLEAKGCIEFDLKIKNTSPSFGEADPYLFVFKKADGNIAMECQFNSNNGVGGSGFFFGGSYERAGCFPATSTSYSEYLGSDDTKGWHHFKCCWNTNGINGAGIPFAVWVDGCQLEGGAINVGTDIATFSNKLNNPLTLFFTANTSTSPFLIDEFKIWKTDMPSEDPVPVELPVVSEVTARQHYPWCGKVDIGYTVAGSTDGLLVKISVKDNDNNVTYEAKTFDVKPTAAAGAHTVVWDATKDGVNKVSKNMVATVSLIVPAE